MPPPKQTHVTPALCSQRRARLWAAILILMAIPCAATGVAWSAKSKAEAVEVKHDAQEKFLRDTLLDIKADLRELREWSRNGKGE